MVSHGRVKRRLKDKIERCIRIASNKESIEYPKTVDTSNLVEMEVTHESDGLPSGKSTCRTDLEATLPDRTLAFEVKVGKGDLVNWFTQRQDYEYLGLSPALVTTKKLAYSLVPHQEAALHDSYILYDDLESEWHWHHSQPIPEVNREFTTDHPVEFVPECPECGCWVNADFPIIHCANCHWRASIDRLEDNDSLVDACWKCGGD